MKKSPLITIVKGDYIIAKLRIYTSQEFRVYGIFFEYSLLLFRGFCDGWDFEEEN